MKKVISMILVFAMMLSITCISAGAVGQENDFEDNGILVDALGNEYELAGYKNGNTFVSTLTAIDGTVISRSVLNCTTGEIVSTVLAEGSNSELMTEELGVADNQQITITESVYDYIVAENAGTTRSGSSYDSRYNYGYKTYKTGMRTDFLYKGKILTGDCSYRCTGYYDESNRESYKFIRGTLLTAIETALFWAIGGGRAGITGLVISLVQNFGVEYVNGKLEADFNPTVSVRSFDMKFRTMMKPNSTNVTMCIIDRQIDYVYAKVNSQDSLIGVDMISYVSEDEAIAGMCSESLGYAAYAFEAKYITQNYPNLSLPVSGPSYTWNV